MSDVTKELEALGIDDLDLDSKEAAQGGYVFIPRAGGDAHCHVLSLSQAKGEKLGKGFRLRVRIVETDIEGCEVDQEYDVLFSFKDKTKANYSNQGLRQIMCGIFGGDVKNVTASKVNERLLSCLKHGEDLAKINKVILLKSVGRVSDKDGKTYYNPVFGPSNRTVEKAAA